MTGQKKIVGLWRDKSLQQDAEVHASAEPVIRDETDVAEAKALAAPRGWLDPLPEDDAASETMSADAEIADGAITSARGDRWIAALLVLAGLMWTGFVAWIASEQGQSVPASSSIPNIALTIAGPLAILLLIWIARLLSGRARISQFNRVAAGLRRENDLLSQSVEGLMSQLAAAQSAMQEQGQTLQQFGLDAAARLHEGSTSLASSANQMVEANAQLAQSGDTAMARMEGLLAGLPRVDDVAQRLAENFAQAGRVAHQHGAGLEAQLALLTERAGAADEAVLKLMGQLGGGFRAMEGQVEKLCNTVAIRSDAAAAVQKRALGLISKEQEAIEARVAESLRTLKQVTHEARETLANGCEASVTDLEERLAQATQITTAMAGQLANHAGVAEKMVKTLETAIVNVDQKLVSLDETVEGRTNAIHAGLSGIVSIVDSFADRTARGHDEVQKLKQGAEDLIAALDAAARELDEGLPAAFDRMEQGAQSARRLVGDLNDPLNATADLAAKIEDSVSAAQRSATEMRRDIVDTHEERLGSLANLQAALHETENELRALSEETGQRAKDNGQLMLASIQKVREASESAARDARSLIEAAVDEASLTLRDRAANALDVALKSEIDTQLKAIETAADRAVSAANGAADKLMRQLITIMDTSASVEQRIAEADTAIARNDRDTLAKQVVILTESLKSTAIDLTKILSSEVSDTAWDAYLKGDRGVFSRRAVKLIDNSDSREILRRYHDDKDFSGHVNQYIHEFEAILRGLMGSRDGQSLSVTLLSSDIGKLYVALAQAIDRLRT